MLSLHVCIIVGCVDVINIAYIDPPIYYGILCHIWKNIFMHHLLFWSQQPGRFLSIESHTAGISFQGSGYITESRV